jgi:hypothetical protein
MGMHRKSLDASTTLLVSRWRKDPFHTNEIRRVSRRGHWPPASSLRRESKQFSKLTLVSLVLPHMEFSVLTDGAMAEHSMNPGQTFEFLPPELLLS